MKKFHLLLISLFLLMEVQAQQFTMVTDGKSNYRIIIPEIPDAVEIQAALVFQDYIQRISGAILTIEPDNIKPADGEILIGKVKRKEMKDVPIEKLLDDGLYIKTTGKKLLIAGGTEKGTLYGVYTFLDKYLGCRKYSSAVTYVPKQKTIILHSINDMEVPSFTYRDILYPDVINDPEYMVWHKLDNCFGKSDNGNVWGSFVHTSNVLLSSKEYGESHPEYFSFYDGKRHPEIAPSWAGLGIQPDAQLCLSNPDVLEIVCKNLKAQIDQNPGALYWSVSQNDNINYCRCPDCAEIDKKYSSFTPGSKMYEINNNFRYSPIGSGSFINFVNKVAERFPDKNISTLAYLYTRVPPKDLIPRKNVNIMLCNIESPRNVPIMEGDKSFCEDLEGWARLTNNIIFWDYVVQFRSLISPFPNLHTLQPNLQYLHDKGVTMIFEEGNPETGGEFHELKAYIIAKLLWDVNVDINKVMDDFLSGYYGNASKMIREYIDLLHNEMAQSGEKLMIYGTPVEEKETFLSDSLITEYNKIFDRAEKAVSGSPEVLKRVKVAHLPVYYAMLEIARDEKTGKRGAFIAGDNNKLKPNPEIVKILYDFAHLCIQTNVSHVQEANVTPLQYLEGYTKFLTEIADAK
jgi:hypothetical protein